MISAYTGNLFVEDSMVESIQSNDFSSLLSELLNRLQVNTTLTHGFIRNSRTGKIKTTCRRRK